MKFGFFEQPLFKKTPSPKVEEPNRSDFFDTEPNERTLVKPLENITEQESPEAFLEKFTNFRKKLFTLQHLFTPAETEQIKRFVKDLNGPYKKRKLIKTGLDTDFVSECNEYGVHEILTEEYIDTLSDYISNNFERLVGGMQELTIVEIGAGNGQLAFFLNEKLKSTGLKMSYRATDSGDRGFRGPFDNVESLDATSAIEKYKPQLVICSWMPLGLDLSPIFRAEENVQEYLLIGPGSELIGTLDTWGAPAWEVYKDQLTYGDRANRFYYEEEWTAKEKAELEHLKKVGGIKLENDGFSMKDIPDLTALQINRLDFGTGCSGDYSTTTSFKRFKK